MRALLIEVSEDMRDKKLRAQQHKEFLELVHTHGDIEVVDTYTQRIQPIYKTYMGSGKLTEIRQHMLAEDIPLLIVGNMLKPAQIFNINEYLRVGDSGVEEEFDLQAWDKIDLLLKIFNHHAQSSEAKLQVELAAIKHMGPRIFGMGLELSRQGGGIGTSGIGETNTEIMRRHLQGRRLQIKKELATYEKVRRLHREARKRRYLPTVGLVGYTNAGKSTLMNALTNKGVLVEDKLFATLGTDVGQLYIPSMTGKGTTILINDTIGFIRDLPPALLDAFRSTLEDSVAAHVLLHVIDVTDPLVHDKIHIVDEILDSIGAEQERILVLNKFDMLDNDTEEDISIRDEIQSMYPDRVCLPLSAVTGLGLASLKELLVEKTKYI